MAKAKGNFLVGEQGTVGTGKRSWRNIGVATILCTVAAAVLSFLGSNPNVVFMILITAFVTIAFLGIFYFTPLLYENVALAPVPDLAFITCVTVMAVNLKNQSDFLVIFLIVILAISAFSKEAWAYAITFLAAIGSMILIFNITGAVSSLGIREVITLVLSLVTFGVLFRILSAETEDLRKKEKTATDHARRLLSERRDVFMIIDNLSEGIIAVDRDRNITLMNKPVLTILGLEKQVEHYLGKNIDEVLVTVADEGAVSVVENAMKDNQPEIRNDLKIVRHDRTTRLHTEARPMLDEHKHAVGAIALLRDITAQTELEDQRSEFLAIASHELRTPLTVIEGYLYYLTTDKALKYDQKTAEYIEKTYNAAEDLIHLSNDILAVVKSDEGHLAVALEKTNLEKLVISTIAKFREMAKKQKIKLESEIGKELPEVITDQQKIGEVVGNLIENAIKFTEKGSVTVKVETKGEQEVLISVVDTGAGISKSDQQNIFQKFYRTEDWQTRKTGGTGLGLYIAKTYITRLGGKMGVESKKGSGSTFWISLPRSAGTGKHEKKQDVQLHDFISNI